MAHTDHRGRDEPRRGDDQGEHGEGDPRGRGAHHDFEDERDDADQQHRHRQESGDEGGVPVRDDDRLRHLPEEDAVQRDGRERDDRAERREHDQGEVEHCLSFTEIGEGRLERKREEESGQDLGARLNDAEFLENLVPVAIRTLGRTLISTVGLVIAGMRVGERGHVLILARRPHDGQGRGRMARPLFYPC